MFRSPWLHGGRGLFRRIRRLRDHFRDAAFNLIARYRDRLSAFEDIMSPHLIDQVSRALESDVPTIAKAERLRTSYWHRLREFMASYDYIITPTIGVAAFRLDQPMPSEIGGAPVERFSDVLLSTYAFSITGLPVIALPCGLNREGLPLSFQIVGHRLREDSVLEAASAYAAGISANTSKGRRSMGKA